MTTGAIVLSIALLGCGRVRFDEVPPPSDTGRAGCIGQLSAYGDMVCVLRTDSSVWCWGQNSEGQLADGTLEDRRVPGPSLITDAIEIATGEDTGCAVRADRSLVCWGEGSLGQLGDGMGEDSAIPRAVALPTGVAQVRASETHVCVRLDDGTGRCWGSNRRALGTEPPPNTQLTPAVAPIQGVAAVTVGDNITCVLRADATAACFGLNTLGELGDGSLESSSVPVVVLVPERIAQIASGCDQHTCAVTEQGSVYCWGRNDFGQLGLGTVSAGEPTPGKVIGLTDAVQVAVGAFHSCARTRSDQILCWGANGFGELGDGTLTLRSSPVQVMGLTGKLVDLQTTCGGSYVVRDDRTLAAWGNAMLLGTPVLVNQVAPIDVPIPCP